MKPVVLRDPSSIQQFLQQGLFFQRVLPPIAETVRPILEWALYLTDTAQSLPPLGLIADLGHVALGIDREFRERRDFLDIPGVPSGLIRAYEDLVLGKIYADSSFERASDALRRFQGKDRLRGLAYLIRQLCERSGLPGIELSPGVIRSMIDLAPEEVIRRGWESLTNSGPMPLLLDLYRSLLVPVRTMAECLGPEDVKALEQRTAIADMGQYVAHRQIVQMANQIERSLPHHKIRPLSGRQEVPTRVLDEDTYPVGGFSSISTRGSIESLLHSQLAYMEPDPSLQPDLFDIKFLRDELYYYSRDENQFLRRRRNFVFVLAPDLVQTRFKDPELPCQRIVMLLSVLSVLVRKLVDWLSTDALKFHFCLLQVDKNRPLLQEAELCEFLFREWIENHTVQVEHVVMKDALHRCGEAARTSMCHVLGVSVNGIDLPVDNAVVTQLQIVGPRPALRTPERQPEVLEAEDSVGSWVQTTERLLQLWV